MKGEEQAGVLQGAAAPAAAAAAAAATETIACGCDARGRRIGETRPNANLASCP